MKATIKLFVHRQPYNLTSIDTKSRCIVAASILIIAAFLRLWDLQSFPLPVNNDELTDIYDAYSIATTGKDRFQHWNPAVMTGFGNGDYHPALYPWLLAIPSMILGISISAARACAALFGLLSLLLLFLTARRIFSHKFAIIALALASLSPWHILYSRTAHAGGFFPAFFTIFILYALVRYLEKCTSYKFLALAGFLCGFSTNSCPAMKALGPMCLILVSLAATIGLTVHDKKLCVKQLTKNNLLIFVMFIVGALPQILTLLIEPEHFFSRAKNSLIAGRFSLNLLMTVIWNLKSHVTPDFLFLSTYHINNLSIARLIPAEMFMFYLGMYSLIFATRQKFNWLLPILYLFAVATLLPAAITTSNPHALRASGFMIIAPLFSAAGIHFVTSHLMSKRTEILATILLLLICSANSAQIISTYLNTHNLKDSNQQNELFQMANTLSPMAHDYDEILIQDFGNQPYIYLISFVPITPAEFISTNKIYSSGEWHHFSEVGKYKFMHPNEIKLALSKNTGQDKPLRILTVTRDQIPDTHIIIKSGGYLFQH